MNVVELDLKSCLSTIEYDPSPHRFDPSETPVSERRKMPLIFTCYKCNFNTSFTLEDFEKHSKASFSNLTSADKIDIDKYLQLHNIKWNSFLDFYCPSCKQPVSIIYDSGPSGYWGAFYFKVKNVLIIQ